MSNPFHKFIYNFSLPNGDKGWATATSYISTPFDKEVARATICIPSRNFYFQATKLLRPNCSDYKVYQKLWRALIRQYKRKLNEQSRSGI